MTAYKKTIEYLYGLIRLGIRPGLETTLDLLAALGDPERSFPAVHVAGTNGKGSTSAIVASILTEAGYRTGLYTSPHLVRLNERIMVSGVEIPDEAVVQTARMVRMASEKTFAAGKKTPTFFEFVTAMAFLYFKESNVDIAVVETGMGGRLDATNVIRPLVSVITNIGLDHTAHLGVALDAIAREKAGVIKEGVPVITGEDAKAAIRVIEDLSQERGSRLYRLGIDFNYEASSTDARFDYHGIEKDYRGLSLNLRGEHQYKNAACALGAVEVLRGAGYRIEGSAVESGLAKVSWPGRLEVLGHNPLIITDCAHNPKGADALAHALRTLFHYNRLILVIGVSTGKDVLGILARLAPLSDRVIVTMSGTERAAPMEALAKSARACGKPVRKRGTVKEAVSLALKETSADDAICVTGSIFTVGEARELIIKNSRGGRRP